MKVNLSDPILIAESPFVNEPGVDRWGYYQFPRLDRLLDGRIAVTFHINADSATAYGKKTAEPNRGVSADGGMSWTRCEDVDPVAGLLLPNGERLLTGGPDVTPPAGKIEDYDLPPERGTVIGSYGQLRYVCYRHDELPPALQGVPQARMKQGGSEWEQERAELHDPGLLRVSTEGVFPVVWWGDVSLMPDGSLRAVVYPSRYEGELFGPMHCTCYRSDDQGCSWQVEGRIGYDPNPQRDSLAQQRDGFTEPASVVLSGGELLAVLRTTDGHGDGPLYQSRSLNGGRDWSRAEVIRGNGALPRLLRLGNGALVLSTGRPGADLSFSADGRGESWSAPTALVPVVGAGNQDDSCGYTSLLALEENTFLVAYSWFKKPDENGQTRKAIYVRRVEVRV